ncbi:MAG: SRPBCC family protein [Chloracidobacterium sp.]
MFVVRASLRRIFEVPASIEQLCEFFSDPRSFARHMPIIEDITPVADSDDVTRWRFCVRVPIVAPITWEFVMHRRVKPETGEIAYSAAEDSPDFFQCDVHVRPNPNGATDADVRLHMRVWRPRARDIHPLAGLVGEHWIARVVTDRMDKMATAFVASGLREIQARAAAQDQAAKPPTDDTTPAAATAETNPETDLIRPTTNGHNGAGHLLPATPMAEADGWHQPTTPSRLDAESSASGTASAEAVAVGAAEGLSSNRTESSFETPGSGIVTP